MSVRGMRANLLISGSVMNIVHFVNSIPGELGCGRVYAIEMRVLIECQEDTIFGRGRDGLRKEFGIVWNRYSDMWI